MKRKIVGLLITALIASSLMVGCAKNNTTSDNTSTDNESPKGGSDYPSRAIEMVVPFNAGGGSDIMARTIHKIITDKGFVDQNINVVNKPGGSGSVGYSYLAQQKGNPHYFAPTTTSYFTAPILGSSPVSYKDFTHIANLAIDTLVVWVKADSPIQTMEQVIEEVKAEPGKYTMGGTSGTSDDFILYNKLKNQAGIDLEYVPFNSGGEVVTSLLGGHIDMAWLNPGEALSQYDAGEVRPIVTASPERLPVLPEIPTLIEIGIDAEFAQYRGIVLPNGVSDEVVEYWEDVMKKLVETEEWTKGYIEANSLIPYFLDSEEFAKTAEELCNDYEKTFKEMKLID